jgi:hypothetical protein
MVAADPGRKTDPRQGGDADRLIAPSWPGSTPGRPLQRRQDRGEPGGAASGGDPARREINRRLTLLRSTPSPDGPCDPGSLCARRRRAARRPRVGSAIEQRHGRAQWSTTDQPEITGLDPAMTTGTVVRSAVPRAAPPGRGDPVSAWLRARRGVTIRFPDGFRCHRSLARPCVAHVSLTAGTSGRVKCGLVSHGRDQRPCEVRAGL